MLKFSKANAKLDQLHDVDELQYWLQDNRKVHSFDLISGWSCPQAEACLSKVHKINSNEQNQRRQEMRVSLFLCITRGFITRRIQ